MVPDSTNGKDNVTPPSKESKKIQEGRDQDPTGSIGTHTSKEKTLPPLLMQPTVPMIRMIKTKKRKGKCNKALTKTRKVVTALINEQLHIDHHCGIHLVKPTTDLSEQFTCTAPHPKWSPMQMPTIPQD